MNADARPDLHSPETYQECVSRIQALTPESRPLWGTMTAAQMFAHCAEVQEVTNGKELRGTPFLIKLFRGVIRRMVLSDKPYPKNSGTHPQYRQKEDRDFEAERRRLLAALDAFVRAGAEGGPGPEHPLFGRLTPGEKGRSMVKHLDHHLRQFGV